MDDDGYLDLLRTINQPLNTHTRFSLRRDDLWQELTRIPPFNLSQVLTYPPGFDCSDDGPDTPALTIDDELDSPRAPDLPELSRFPSLTSVLRCAAASSDDGSLDEWRKSAVLEVWWSRMDAAFTEHQPLLSDATSSNSLCFRPHRYENISPEGDTSSVDSDASNPSIVYQNFQRVIFAMFEEERSHREPPKIEWPNDVLSDWPRLTVEEHRAASYAKLTKGEVYVPPSPSPVDISPNRPSDESPSTKLKTLGSIKSKVARMCTKLPRCI